jgi:hypothetical protein
MRRSSFTGNFGVAIIAVCCLSAGAAQAAKSRVWVSGRGTDAAGCGEATTPCRQISFVLDSGLVSPRGEIAIVDSAGFGSFVVKQAVSIINEGAGTASVQEPAAGKTAILVSAGVSDRVILRGLDVGGAGTGQTGIAFTSGASLSIEKCVVHDFAVSGIGLGPRGSANVVIAHTVAENNGGHGLYVQPRSAEAINVSVMLRDVEAYSNGGNGVGIYGNFVTPSANVRAVAVNSTASGNKGSGFYALGASTVGVGGQSSNTHLILIRSTAQANAWGARADAHALIYTSASDMFHNTEFNLGAADPSQQSWIFTYSDNISEGTGAGGKFPLDKR